MIDDRSYQLPLPSAFCLLLSAFCLLPSAFCFLPSAFCLLPSAFCLLLSPPCFLFSPSVALAQRRNVGDVMPAMPRIERHILIYAYGSQFGMVKRTGEILFLERTQKQNPTAMQR